MNPALDINEAFVASHSCTDKAAVSSYVLPEANSLLLKFLNVQVSDTTGDATCAIAHTINENRILERTPLHYHQTNFNYALYLRCKDAMKKMP